MQQDGAGGAARRTAAISWDWTGGEEPQTTCGQGRVVDGTQLSESKCLWGRRWCRMD